MGSRRTVVLFGEVWAEGFPGRSLLGGAPFNVARHLQQFGLHPVLITRVGDDELKDQILAEMARLGMDTLGVQFDKRHPTGRVKIHGAETESRVEIPPQQAFDFIHPGVVHLITLSQSPALVYFSSLSQRADMSGRALKALLRSTDAPRFLDINLRAPWYTPAGLQQAMQQAHILKLNAGELETLVDQLKLTETGEEAQTKALMCRFDLQRVLVSGGEQGAWQVERNGKRTSAAIDSSNVVDTTGAGDAFTAVCMLGEVLRWPRALTLQRACAFAGAISGIPEAVPTEPDFYTPFIREWDKAITKVQTPPQAELLVA